MKGFARRKADIEGAAADQELKFIGSEVYKSKWQGPSHDQLSESENKIQLASLRPTPTTLVLPPDPNPENVGPMGMTQQMKQSQTSKRVPSPIAVPLQSIPYRLITSTRRRTISSASMEALDGTTVSPHAIYGLHCIHAC